MRLVFTTILIALLSSDVLAFSIRSGEHGNFTRLVIQFDDPSEWELTPLERGYVLTSEGIPVVQDLAQVFQLIPRTRLADIRQEDTGSLLFDLACECHTETLELARNRLVIDFKPGPDPELVEKVELDPAAVEENDGLAVGSLSPSVSATEPDALEPQIVPPSPHVELDGSTPRNLPEPLSDNASTAEMEIPFKDRKDDQSSPLTPVDVSPVKVFDASPAVPLTPSLEVPGQPNDRNVGAFEHDLARTLAKAMSDGLIETPVPSRQNTTRLGRGTEHAGPSPHSRLEASEPDASTSADNHRTHTQTEIDLSREAAISSRTGHSKCDSPALPIFLLVEGETYNDLADHRAEVIDAGGNIRSDGLERLLRFYLRQGFGAEARQILLLPDFNPENATAYLQISHLVDGERPGDPAALTGELRCGGDAALWEVLASDRIPSLTDDMRKAIAKGFLLLPPGMKQSIGPQLAKKLIANGEARQAKTMLAQLERSSRSRTFAGLVRAEIAMIDEDYDVAKSILTKEIAMNSVSAPYALLLLLEKLDEISLDEGELRRMIVLADAYAFEHRGTPMETKLKRVTLHRKAQAGNLRDALKSMTVMELSKNKDSQALLAELLRTGLPHLDDFGLAAFLSDDRDLLDYLGPGDPVLEATLRRAGKLGLPNLTEDLMTRFPAMGPVLEAELRASVALDHHDETRMAAALRQVDPTSRDALQVRLDIRRRLPERKPGAPNKERTETAKPVGKPETGNPVAPQEALSEREAGTEPADAFENSNRAIQSTDDLLEKLEMKLGEADDAPTT